MRLNLFPHPLREPHRRVEHRARKEQHELLPAVAPHAIDLAHFLAKDARELLEHRVASLVPVSVVHALEAIEVAHHARERLVQPFGVLEHLLEALFEMPTIIESRESVRL